MVAATWDLLMRAASTLAEAGGTPYQDPVVDAVWREGRLDGLLDAITLVSGIPRMELPRMVRDLAERYYPDGPGTKGGAQVGKEW